MTPDIWVDFNEIDEDGVTTTLLEFVNSDAALEVGRELSAGDEDGNWCPARVEAVNDHVVTLRLDLERMHRTQLGEFVNGLASCGNP